MNGANGARADGRSSGSLPCGGGLGLEAASPNTPHPNPPPQGGMGRKRVARGFVAMLLLVNLCGCNNGDADRLARFGTALAHKVDTIVAGSNGRIVRGWQTVPLQLGEVAIDARVSARLHWEKSLGEANIDVHAVGTAIELRGKVRNVEQRRKAVELAEATTGVDKVTDSMEELP